jgi:predicted signal transduction protein with EAL and GGDEF domain
MFNTSVEELTGETFVVEADLAMYDAKEAGGDGHAFYATSEHRISRTKARLTWVSRIEQALEEDRFALLAQLILDSIPARHPLGNTEDPTSRSSLRVARTGPPAQNASTEPLR